MAAMVWYFALKNSFAQFRDRGKLIAREHRKQLCSNCLDADLDVGGTPRVIPGERDEEARHACRSAKSLTTVDVDDRLDIKAALGPLQKAKRTLPSCPTLPL
ncbi:unnamed protein product [Clonostachys solani]|uniref:Uncharacterized protein n=1 Tax=Clonostachys solani TaxID=160281 RepID=A0A9P0ETQ6_9HYPO|nr:unnamed protein product [Clonostachys solani]